MTWHRGFAWTAACITGAVLCTAVWLMAQDPSPVHLLILAAAVLLGVVPAAAGVFVAQDHETGVLGVLLVLPGLNAALLFTEVLAQDVAAPPPEADYVTAASQGTWILLYVVVALPLLFFPEGRLGSRLGRWLFAVILLDAAVFMLTAATAPGPFLPPDQSTPHVLGTMPGPLATALTAVSLPLLPISLILIVVDLTRRYRASEPGRRRQYRWLTLAATFLPVTILGAWISYALIGRAGAVVAIGLGITYLALPTLIAVAVRRPDLFDADRALVATVTRSIILAGLLTLYTAANAIAGLLLSARSPAVAIAVTAGAAILLAPLGRRLQRYVDSRLYRARHAAFESIAELHRETLQARAGPEELQQRLRDALADQTLVVGYCTPASGDVVDARGAAMQVPEPLVEITIGPERIGVLSTRAPIAGELVRAIAPRRHRRGRCRRARPATCRQGRDAASSALASGSGGAGTSARADDATRSRRSGRTSPAPSARSRAAPSSPCRSAARDRVSSVSPWNITPPDVTTGRPAYGASNGATRREPVSPAWSATSSTSCRVGR